MNIKSTGLYLEDIINQTHKIYKERGVLLGYKKPTPICVLQTKGSVITKAFFEKKSSTDYTGVYQGRYFDFEAKTISGEEASIKKIFPPHQILHLLEVARHGGISFAIVYFSKYNRFFLYPIQVLSQLKTISIDNQAEGYEINFNGLYIDYLPQMEKLCK